MDEVTKAKFESELEWRRLLFTEVKEVRSEVGKVRKELNNFKLKMIGYISALVVAGQMIGKYFKL